MEQLIATTQKHRWISSLRMGWFIAGRRDVLDVRRLSDHLQRDMGFLDGNDPSRQARLDRALEIAYSASSSAAAVRSSVIRPLTRRRATAARIAGSLSSPMASAITCERSRDGKGALATRSLVMPSM